MPFQSIAVLSSCLSLAASGVKHVALQIAAGCLRVDPYPAANQVAITNTPYQTGFQGIPIPPGNGYRGKEDGPFWYFLGLPLVLEVFPRISVAGRGLEARGTRLHIRRS